MFLLLFLIFTKLRQWFFFPSSSINMRNTTSVHSNSKFLYLCIYTFLKYLLLFSCRFHQLHHIWYSGFILELTSVESLLAFRKNLTSAWEMTHTHTLEQRFSRGNGIPRNMAFGWETKNITVNGEDVRKWWVWWKMFSQIWEWREPPWTQEIREIRESSTETNPGKTEAMLVESRRARLCLFHHKHRRYDVHMKWCHKKNHLSNPWNEYKTTVRLWSSWHPHPSFFQWVLSTFNRAKFVEIHRSCVLPSLPTRSSPSFNAPSPRLSAWSVPFS